MTHTIDIADNNITDEQTDGWTDGQHKDIMLPTRLTEAQENLRDNRQDVISHLSVCACVCVYVLTGPANRRRTMNKPEEHHDLVQQSLKFLLS